MTPNTMLENLFGKKNSDDVELIDQLVMPPEPVPIDENAPRYIIHQQQIDTKTVKRTRRLLTPAVCDKCGVDILDYNYQQGKISTNNYNQLPEKIQEQIKDTVTLHKRLRHSASEELIVTEKPRHWLSGRDLIRS